MKANLYVIRDLVEDSSGFIFEARNDGSAHRMYEKIVSARAEQGARREEFQLRCVGAIDHDTDMVIPAPAPRVVPPTARLEEEVPNG